MPVMTTTAPASAQIRSSTIRCPGVGERSTVCSTTIAGALRDSSTCSTSSPSVPP